MCAYVCMCVYVSICTRVDVYKCIIAYRPPALLPFTCSNSLTHYFHSLTHSLTQTAKPNHLRPSDLWIRIQVHGYTCTSLTADVRGRQRNFMAEPLYRLQKTIVPRWRCKRLMTAQCVIYNLSIRDRQKDGRCFNALRRS